MSEAIHNLSVQCSHRKAKRCHQNNRVIRIERAKPPLQTKSVIRAAWLAALGGILAVPGVGHLSLGYVTKGLIILALGWAIIAAGAGLYLAGLAEFDLLGNDPEQPTIFAGVSIVAGAAFIYLWQVLDAIVTATRWNRSVAQRY